ncbi:MAG: hypothetical protein M1819_005195 [Sarea resinae]|nr:MAG: hypothetical protein M1819_005195 [Sarea resinae]
MLRVSILSGRRLVAGPAVSRIGSPWLAVRGANAAVVGQKRFFADKKDGEKESIHDSNAAVLPGSQSTTTSHPTPSTPGAIHPISPGSPSPAAPSSNPMIPPENVPLTPPAPPGGKQQTAPPTSIPPSTAASVPPIPPPGSSGSKSLPPPAPKRKPRRFRRFLYTLTLLTGLGYAGGVYYSLISDEFHDIFTEYVPFGEDIVLYFEEREFHRRFPNAAAGPNRMTRPPREEGNKVTIPSNSGLSWRVVDEESSGDKGPHVSAVQRPAEPGKEEAKPVAPAPKAKEEPKPAAPSKSTTAIDPLNIEAANEPVVQDLVKIINNIITVVNADQASEKYASAINSAKAEFEAVGGRIKSLKDAEKKAAEDKIRASHEEFDKGAKELVRRLEEEMREQEARWKEEFEAEREKLSESYSARLKAELERSNQVSEQRLRNQLLEQAIEMKRKFIDDVKERVEQERDGRLGKLSELSTSVSELEKLTTDWNSVVDANLKTQHLHVAVEAVRANLEKADRPRPFVRELAALKEIASDDPVVNAAIASINPSAYQRGISTPAQLIDRFRRVAGEVRKASLLPEDAGIASHAASFVLSKFMFKKKGLAVGDDVESVLTRTETFLEEGNLDEAAREMNGLQGWAKTLSKDWLGEVRKVLEVQQALDVIATEARLQSLRVD